MPVYSPAFAGTHYPTPEGWHAELALVHSSHGQESNLWPRDRNVRRVPLGHRVPVYNSAWKQMYFKFTPDQVSKVKRPAKSTCTRQKPKFKTKQLKKKKLNFDTEKQSAYKMARQKLQEKIFGSGDLGGPWNENKWWTCSSNPLPKPFKLAWFFNQIMWNIRNCYNSARISNDFHSLITINSVFHCTR